MQTPIFGDSKIKQEFAVNPLPGIIFHFRKPLIEYDSRSLKSTLQNIYNLYLKYNTIKSFYAKSAMTEKKCKKECLFIRRNT